MFKSMKFKIELELARHFSVLCQQSVPDFFHAEGLTFERQRREAKDSRECEKC